MNIEKLQNTEKVLLDTDDISEILSINRSSAQVTASRYTDQGRLIRLKRDMYILPQKLKLLTEEELFGIANLVQTPSYVSLTSALSYYDLSTQQLRNFIESVCLRRTKIIRTELVEFNFSKVKRSFYFGFERRENFFIAYPAKALADAIYLTSMGRYDADFDAVDMEKFNKDEICEILKNTNRTAQNLWRKLIKTYKI